MMHHAPAVHDELHGGAGESFDAIGSRRALTGRELVTRRPTSPARETRSSGESRGVIGPKALRETADCAVRSSRCGWAGLRDAGRDDATVIDRAVGIERRIEDRGERSTEIDHRRLRDSPWLRSRFRLSSRDGSRTAHRYQRVAPVRGSDR
jgi:hypothetical protein